MNSTLKSLVFWMVLVVVGVLIWNFSTKFQQTRPRPITFSEFMSQVDAGHRRARRRSPARTSPASPRPTRTSTPTRPTQYEGLVNKLIDRGVMVHGEGADGQPVGVAAVFVGADPADDRLLDLLHAPDAERRQQGAVVRQEQGEAARRARRRRSRSRTSPASTKRRKSCRRSSSSSRSRRSSRSSAAAFPRACC